MKNYTRKGWMFLLMSALCFAVGGAVAGEKVAVIVNAANKQALDVNDVKNMYSDIVIHWANGQSVDMYDLPIKEEARAVFSQKVLGMSAAAAAREWANRKITNTAKNPPKTSKEELVVKRVAKNADAIGYVSAAAAEGKDGIKVLFVLE